jgi:hypothetical protein
VPLSGITRSGLRSSHARPDEEDDAEGKHAEHDEVIDVVVDRPRENTGGDPTMAISSPAIDTTCAVSVAPRAACLPLRIPNAAIAKLAADTASTSIAGMTGGS